MSEMVLFLSVATLAQVLLGICYYRWLKLQEAKREIKENILCLPKEDLEISSQDQNQHYGNIVQIAACTTCCEVMVDAHRQKMAANSCPHEESLLTIQIESPTENLMFFHS